MDATKKAVKDAAADVGGAMTSVKDAAGQGLKSAGQAVDSKADACKTSISKVAQDGADGATGLMNKGVDTLK